MSPPLALALPEPHLDTPTEGRRSRAPLSPERRVIVSALLAVALAVAVSAEPLGLPGAADPRPAARRAPRPEGPPVGPRGQT